MPYFPENPWVSLCSPADHQAICASVFEHFGRFLRCPDIAIGENRDGNTVADLADRIVFGFSLETVGTCPSMYSERGNSGLFRHFRDQHTVALERIRTGTNLQAHRYVDR